MRAVGGLRRRAGHLVWGLLLAAGPGAVGIGGGSTAQVPLIGAAPLAAQAESSTLAAARRAWRAGEYGEALELAGRLGRDAAALALRARVLSETGRLEDALRLVGGEAGPAPDPALALVRGELLLASGRWEAAAEAASRASGSVAHRAPARALQARILELQGRSDEALALHESFFDLYQGMTRPTVDDLLAVGRAMESLGRRDPVLFQDALRAFDEAAEVDPGDPRPRVAVGELFLEKYDAPEAHASFDAVLAVNPRHPDALLGEARAREFDGAPGFMELAEQALEVNPGHVGARVFRARQFLRSGEYARARAEAERALEVNPRALEALAVLAAADRLEGDVAGFTRTRDRIQALSPGWAGLHVTVAELLVDARKYAEAVRVAREAVALDSLSWQGWGLLGINQLRTQALEEGRANLERAFAGDPYNAWFKNTLDLLDTFERYETVRSEHFEFMIRADEVELLAPYVTEVAERAWQALAERYGATPPAPVRVELFPSSADFSVRTFGLAGLGALGVSFGSTLVMDSPAAREPGDFNWLSTFWHELAHAFHLALSEHEVPRWFSEGLAVREQRVADPSWGMHLGTEWLRVYDAGRMPPPTQLDRAFVRPAFPGQVQLAYFQGSLVFDWLEAEVGMPGIRAFLEGYRRGGDTEELVEEVTGMDPEAFDTAFDVWVRERFAREFASVSGANDTGRGDGPGVASGDDPRPPAGPGEEGATLPGDLPGLRRAAAERPGDFRVRLAYGRELVRAERWAAAEEQLQAAYRLFPSYGGPEGPLVLLARVHEARGELRPAADLLRRAATLDESALELSRREAELRRELGDSVGEREALQRVVQVHPYDADAHTRLAELHAAAGDHRGAVRERRALLALEPVDRADAHYRLALALRDAGEPGEARSQVLRALEIAPAFEAALELLLQLRGGGGGP
jgi:tetratricopeptide (TPR) repeat protein